MSEKEQGLIHEQTTLSEENIVRPIWPPPPRRRPRQGPAKFTKILLIVLATLLIASGLGFIIYTATNQFGTALGVQQSVNLQATVQAQARTAGVLQSTAQPLATAQAQIIASATAQDQPTMTAQAIGDEGTATATALENILTQDTTGTANLDDPLSDNSQKHSWDEGYSDNNNTGCNFINGNYQVQEGSQGFLQTCFADATNFRNFAYQVSLTFKSSGQGGILFRGNKTIGQYYLFTIDTNGNYILEIYNGQKYTPIANGFSTAITTGEGLSNDLTVIADKNIFYLFINQTYVASASNSTASAGQIGVVAINTNLPATIDFSDAEVWKLS
jgi:hypothetical protein